MKICQLASGQSHSGTVCDFFNGRKIKATVGLNDRTVLCHHLFLLKCSRHGRKSQHEGMPV